MSFNLERVKLEMQGSEHVIERLNSVELSDGYQHVCEVLGCHDETSSSNRSYLRSSLVSDSEQNSVSLLGEPVLEEPALVINPDDLQDYSLSHRYSEQYPGQKYHGKILPAIPYSEFELHKQQIFKFAKQNSNVVMSTLNCELNYLDKTKCKVTCMSMFDAFPNANHEHCLNPYERHLPTSNLFFLNSFLQQTDTSDDKLKFTFIKKKRRFELECEACHDGLGINSDIHKYVTPELLEVTFPKCNHRSTLSALQSHVLKHGHYSIVELDQTISQKISEKTGETYDSQSKVDHIFLISVDLPNNDHDEKVDEPLCISETSDNSESDSETKSVLKDDVETKTRKSKVGNSRRVRNLKKSTQTMSITSKLLQLKAALEAIKQSCPEKESRSRRCKDKAKWRIHKFSKGKFIKVRPHRSTI